MKIGIFDIETSSLYANTGIFLCGIIKDYHVDETRTYRADTYPSWEKQRSDNKEVVLAFVNDLNQYDILIAHNGQYFDKTFLASACLRYGERPSIRFTKFIDPVMLARRHMRLARNSLTALLDYFDIEGDKTPIRWKHWMQATLDGNKESMDYIVEHCIVDVAKLEQVYDKVRTLVKGIDERGSAY